MWEDIFLFFIDIVIFSLSRGLSEVLIMLLVSVVGQENIHQRHWPTAAAT